MSVTTDADNKLRKARENYSQALDLLREAGDLLESALHKETWGSDQFSREGEKQIRKSQVRNIKMIGKLTDAYAKL